MPKLSRIKRILTPVDFSKPSLAALRYARSLAKFRHARLDVLHVVEALAYAPMVGSSVDLSRLREAQELAAERQLEKVASELRRHRIRGTTMLKVGAAASAIVDHAKKSSTDLIVMATEGRGFVKHLLGSVAERVVRSAPCPVLTLRAGALLRANKLRRVLVATDFSAPSNLAVDYAVELARSTNAELIVLNVVETVALAGDVHGFATSAAMQNEVERASKESLARLVGRLQKKKGLRCKSVLGAGTAAVGIVDTATKIAADIVVVGTHGHGGLERIFLGSVAERVVRTSPRPVLTVRGIFGAAKTSPKSE
jgi:nucleotide-binding universal stress UspA family protein